MRHLLLLLPLLASPLHAEPPKVVTDIAPVQSLVSMVLGTVPPVLTGPADDPHHMALRPSQARALAQADLTVWIGPALTPWLSEVADPARSLILLDTAGTHLRGADDHHAEEEYARHEDHEEETHTGHAHAKGLPDPHAWLDPDNAHLWLTAIAKALAAIDPSGAATYTANAAAASARISALQTELQTTLTAPPTILTAHNAYGYFTAAYAIPTAGALTGSDAETASAARLRALRSALTQSPSPCLFTEPGSSAALFAALGVDPSKVRTLDPIGAALAQGPDLYPALLRAMANTIATCRD